MIFNYNYNIFNESTLYNIDDILINFFINPLFMFYEIVIIISGQNMYVIIGNSFFN